MTIAALRALLDDELPDVPRHPAPRLPRQRFTAKESTTMPATTRPNPAQAAETLSVEELIEWGAAHDDREVQDQAERARMALTGLRKRHSADTELSALLSEEEQLQARLEALQARKGELLPTKQRRRVLALDHEPAVVRGWAKANGVECPDRGRVPARVLEQWRAATGRPTVTATAAVG